MGSQRFRIPAALFQGDAFGNCLENSLAMEAPEDPQCRAVCTTEKSPQVNAMPFSLWKGPEYFSVILLYMATFSFQERYGLNVWSVREEIYGRSGNKIVFPGEQGSVPGESGGVAGYVDNAFRSEFQNTSDHFGS